VTRLRAVPSRSEARARRASARVFAALGDPTRLALVAQLCAEGPSSIVRLTSGTEITRQAVSKHLRALEAAGLARAERAGRERVWALRPERLEETRHYLNQISTQWDQALQRLRALVEFGAG
jgi:DNA-binding transcriptional ArsR family regulator